MTVETETVAECRRLGCEWVPDPARRMSLASQAEEHTRDAGHVTVTRTAPRSPRSAGVAAAGGPIRDGSVLPDPPAGSGPQGGVQR